MVSPRIVHAQRLGPGGACTIGGLWAKPLAAGTSAMAGQADIVPGQKAQPSEVSSTRDPPGNPDTCASYLSEHRLIGAVGGVFGRRMSPSVGWRRSRVRQTASRLVTERERDRLQHPHTLTVHSPTAAKYASAMGVDVGACRAAGRAPKEGGGGARAWTAVPTKKGDTAREGKGWRADVSGSGP